MVGVSLYCVGQNPGSASAPNNIFLYYSTKFCTLWPMIRAICSQVSSFYLHISSNTGQKEALVSQRGEVFSPPPPASHHHDYMKSLRETDSQTNVLKLTTLVTAAQSHAQTNCCCCCNCYYICLCNLVRLFLYKHICFSAIPNRHFYLSIYLSGALLHNNSFFFINQHTVFSSNKLNRLY